MERVQHYSKNDYSYHTFDARIIEVIKNIEINNIEDAIEYHKIVELYKGNNNFLEELKEESVKEINIQLNIFLNKNNNIIDFIEEIKDSNYNINDLFELISNYKKDLLTNEVIATLCQNNVGFYDSLLKIKEIKKYVESNTKSIITSNNVNLIEAVVKNLAHTSDTNLFSYEEKEVEEIIDFHLEKDVNPNYLMDIYNSKNKKINARIRMKAKEKYDEFVESNFNGNNGFTREFEFKIINGHEETEISIDENGNYYESWNFDKEIKKYSSISFVTYEGIFKFLLNDIGYFYNNKITVAHYNQDTFKGISSIIYQGNNTYTSDNHEFMDRQNIQIRRLALFIMYLETKKINIYKFINYLIDIILDNNFYSIDGSDKIQEYGIETINKHLCVQIESLISQYACYNKYGIIRKDYVLLDSNTLYMKQIRSKNINNAYVKYDIYIKLMDSQSVFVPIKSIQQGDETFYDQIKLEKISKKHNISDFEMKLINYLIEEEVVNWENNILKFINIDYLKYWEELYQTGSLIYSENSIVDDMLNNDLLQFDNNLLDKFEIDYFNYIFNNQIYNDGLAIRNKYLHTGFIDLNEEEVNLILIKLLLEIIMKIMFSNYADEKIN